MLKMFSPKPEFFIVENCSNTIQGALAVVEEIKKPTPTQKSALRWRCEWLQSDRR